MTERWPIIVWSYHFYRIHLIETFNFFFVPICIEAQKDATLERDLALGGSFLFIRLFEANVRNNVVVAGLSWESFTSRTTYCTSNLC